MRMAPVAQRSYLADVLTTLFERRWQGARPKDARSLEEMCLALLDAEGEVSGIYLAQAILRRYAELDAEAKRAFFLFLNDALEVDVDALRASVEAYGASGDAQDYRKMAKLAEPRRQELLRRLNQPPGATPNLVSMRADLLKAMAEDPELARSDRDFQHLLRSWFNRGFLVLRQISWDTPASILEKIVAYEAVHAIDDWEDLRRRLYPADRRCFAYFHPAMPDEPLIFVEVALTVDVPGSIQRVLSDKRQMRSAEETKTAVFYSISNCQSGLKGISFGNFLIKQVVDELRQELPGLETFVTLSPIPGFARWWHENADTKAALAAFEEPKDAEVVAKAAAQYLVEAKNSRGQPYDPVARFHLGNGAQIYAVHGDADLSDKGQAQSFGAMVNYHYDLKSIEQNHRDIENHRQNALQELKNLSVTLIEKVEKNTSENKEFKFDDYVKRVKKLARDSEERIKSEKTEVQAESKPLETPTIEKEIPVVEKPKAAEKAPEPVKEPEKKEPPKIEELRERITQQKRETEIASPKEELKKEEPQQTKKQEEVKEVPKAPKDKPVEEAEEKKGPRIAKTVSFFDELDTDN